MIWIVILVVVLVIALAVRVLLPTKHCSEFHVSDTPFKQTALTSEDHHLLLSIMDRLDKLFKGKVPYFLIGGSLMGAVRYGNRMPWDDDIDIGILQEDLEKILSLDYLSVGLKIRKSEHGYKVYDASRNRSKMLEKTFPFIDIFVYRKDGDVYNLANDKARKTWPRESFPERMLFPLTTCKYGGMDISCPATPIEFLDQAYPGWDRIAYINGSHTGGLLYRNYTMPVNESTTTAVLAYLATL